MRSLKISFLALIIFCLYNLPLQTQVIISDDFEFFDLYDYICLETDHWETWSGNEGGIEDVYVLNPISGSDNQAISLVGDPNFPLGGPSDILLKLGDKTSGKYEVSFDMYILGASGAYYNFQHFEEPGVEWAFSVEAHSAGLINNPTTTVVTVAGQYELSFQCPREEWVRWTHIIDLDNDLIQLILNGENKGEWQFSQKESSTSLGTNQLGAVNFYPDDHGDIYHIDNVVFEDLLPSNTTDLNHSEVNISPNPSSGEVFFGFEDESNINYLEVYDVSGLRIKHLEVEGGVLEFTIDRPGLYYVKYRHNNLIMGYSKLVIVQ